MVPDGAELFRMIKNAARWSRIVPDGARLHRMNHMAMWFTMTQEDAIWSMAVHDGMG